MRPEIIVEASFSRRPTETPTWVDITAYVEEIHCRRGRNTELDRVEAGTATVMLRDPDYRFDPANAAGPYYGQLVPMRRLRIRTADFGIFAGYVESWPLVTEGVGYRRVRVDLVDAFGPIAASALTASYPEQRTDQRIDAVLDDCAWTIGGAWILGSATDSVLGSTTILGPIGDRALDQGNTRVQAVTLENVSALQHLQDVAQLEMGLLYVTGGGVVRFRNRHSCLQNLAPRMRLGDARSIELGPTPEEPLLGSQLWPYADLVPEYDDRRIVNVCRVRRQGQNAWFTAQSASSRLDYFPRPLVRDYVPLAGESEGAADNEAASLARWVVRLYAQPRVRISSLVLDLHTVPDLWKAALGCDLGDRVSVVRATATGAVSHACLVEGIEHDITEDDWRVTWRLSPADTTAYWRLGDANRSQLGVTTTLAH